MAIRFANIVLSVLAFLCLGFLLFFLMRHGWAINYLFLLAPIGILVGSLTLPGRIRIDLALFLCALAGSCYLSEGVLALKTASPWLQVNSKDKPASDTRGRLQVIDDLKRQGITAYPSVFPKLLVKTSPLASERVNRSMITINGVETVPLGGISNVFTVLCNESGKYVTYTSDEYGFHNPSGIWAAPRIDIVALGDSNTHGACVPSEKSFVGWIRSRNPVTLNLGMSGNGPLTMLATLKEYARSRRPKSVLWFYYEGNDLNDLGRERLSPVLIQYLNELFEQGLLSRQPEIDTALINYVNESATKERERLEKREEREQVGWEHILKLYHLRQSLVAVYKRYERDKVDQDFHRSMASWAPDEEFEVFRNVLIEADKTVRRWGGQLYFVYLPQWARYANPELANTNRERVLSMVEILGLTIIDIHPAFAAHKDPLALFSFRRSAAGHYSEEGYQLVAEEVLRAFSKADAPPSNEE